MRSTREFIKDGLLLTLTTMILRTAGVFFSARLSVLAGTSVMGLYTQIMSVYAFAVTAASAGVNLGSLRITSETYGCGDAGDLYTCVRESVSYALKAGVTVSVIFFFGAPFFGGALLCDTRTVSSLRALAIALPFIAVSNALHGYFSGVKMIGKSALVSLLEQGSRITMTLLALGTVNTSDTEAVCLTLVICNALSEVISCFLLTVLCIFDIKRFKNGKRGTSDLKKRFIGITVPVALSALIRSALTTSEHILIPIGLRANGADTESALSVYGIVSGMVMPILLYPMALLSAFASISIAELSAMVSAGEIKDRISKTVSKGISLALMYGIGCSAFIRYFSDILGISVYHNASVGGFMRIMAPLVIFMYLDHISDGMLKGLDKQNYVMKVNITDAALSVLFAIILIPRFGIYGFIASVYICEMLNCTFSFGRLMFTSGIKVDLLKALVLPALCSVIAIWSVSAASGLEVIKAWFTKSAVFPILSAAAIYIVLLKATGALGEKKSRTVFGVYFKRVGER